MYIFLLLRRNVYRFFHKLSICSCQLLPPLYFYDQFFASIYIGEFQKVMWPLENKCGYTTQGKYADVHHPTIVHLEAKSWRSRLIWLNVIVHTRLLKLAVLHNFEKVNKFRSQDTAKNQKSWYVCPGSNVVTLKLTNGSVYVFHPRCLLSFYLILNDLVVTETAWWSWNRIVHDKSGINHGEPVTK